MKLYALCDKLTLQKKHISLQKFIQISKSQNAEIIQYRNKNFDEVESDLKEIRKYWSGILILNDYLAFQSLVDGYHIGQEDLQKYKSIKNIRKTVGKKILGLSTHNKSEILEANSLDIDYIGLGAFRKTGTKKVSNILGENADKFAKFSKHDVGIIGGVKLSDKFENAKYLVIGSGLL